MKKRYMKKRWVYEETMRELSEIKSGYRPAAELSTLDHQLFWYL